MAVKGTLAKKYIIDQLKLAFGSKFLGESGGKVYISAPDGSEMVQIAVTLTCAKTPVSLAREDVPSAWDVEAPPKEEIKVNIEITEAEKANIANLLEKLGL